MSTLKVNSIIPSGGFPSGANGGIIQCVFQENNTIQSFSFSSSSFSPQTICSATITPSSNSNKILAYCSAGVFVSGQTGPHYEHSLFLKRGSTLIGGNTQSGYFPGTNVLFSGINAPECGATGNFFYLDSPATTSATTYNLCLQGGESATYGVCRSQYSSSSSQFTNTSGVSMTLLEVTA